MRGVRTGFHSRLTNEAMAGAAGNACAHPSYRPGQTQAVIMPQTCPISLDFDMLYAIEFVFTEIIGHRAFNSSTM